MLSRPRGHDRHDRRAAGDRPDHEDPGRPGRPGDLRGADLPRRRAGVLQLRGRRDPDRVRRRRDAGGRAARPLLDRPRGGGAPAEVHLLGADLPEPGRGDALAGAPPAAGRAGARARAAGRRGQPLRPPALRGRAAAAAVPARRRRLRRLPRHLLEDPLARDPARLGGRATAGDGEGRPRQAGHRPLHLDPDPVLRRASTSPRGAGGSTSTAWSGSTAIAATRCSRRSSGTSRRRRPGPSPQGGLFIWATLPDYIDTGDLLAKALRENVAFVPGQAAYVDGRGRELDAAQLLRGRRGRDPRGDPPDRRGRQRAGRALRDADRRAPTPHPAPAPEPSRAERACPGRRRRAAVSPRRREGGG